MFVIAEKYGQSPEQVEEWSDYHFQKALLYHAADNGGTGITEDDVQLEIEKRRKGKMSAGYILEHTPSYWTERTREQVTNEGYNADYVAEELGKMDLALAGETVHREGAEPVSKPSQFTPAPKPNVPALNPDNTKTGPLTEE